MRAKTEKLIEKLWGNDSVKDVFIKTENILYSKSESMRKSSFVPVLITDDMFSVESFGKIYSVLQKTLRQM